MRNMQLYPRSVCSKSPRTRAADGRRFGPPANKRKAKGSVCKTCNTTQGLPAPSPLGQGRQTEDALGLPLAKERKKKVGVSITGDLDVLVVHLLQVLHALAEEPADHIIAVDKSG